MDTARTKTIFWIGVALITLLFVVLAALVMEAVGLALGHRDWGGQGGTAAFPCFLLSVAIMIAFLRRLGLLERERAVETLRRLPDAGPVAPDAGPVAPDAGPVALESPVEIRTRRSLWMASALTLDAFAVLILILVAVLPAVPGTKPWGCATAAFFALFSLGPWCGYATRAGLVARVDRTGVRGDCVGPKSSARWAKIASCEITMLPLPWGRFTRYTFRDVQDKTLMRLMLTADGAEQKRFEDAVRESFG